MKRIPVEISRDLKAVAKKFHDITWSTLTFEKFFKGIRNFHLKNSYFESMRSPKGIATLAAPVLAAVLLVLTVCFWTCSDSPLTVSVGGEYIASIENEGVLTQASAQVHSALSATDATEAASPVIQVSLPSLSDVQTSNAADVYEKLVDHNDAVVSDAAGLYVDGVFYGAAENSEALSLALTQVLDEAKAKYDSTTTTTFNNDVQVVPGVYAVADVKTVDDLIESARQSFSVRLETDLTVDYDIDYATVYEYDDTQLDNYSEVKVQGVKGTERIYYRLVYIDGVQTDAVIQSSTVVTEPVDQVLIVGTQQSYTGTGNFTWPVPSCYEVSSHYKWRWGRQHSGIDIAGSGIYGQDIVASDAGTVVWAGWDSSGYGNYVIIDHGNGYETLYGHCSSVYVSIGDKVSRGDTIAAVGATGNVTGTHLHFEIWDNGVKVDPYPYVS